MLHIRVDSPNQSFEFRHSAGAIEFGRGPAGELPRRTIDDPYISRDQLALEEVAPDRLVVNNLSDHVAVEVVGEAFIAIHESRVLQLPVEIRCGKTTLQVSIAAAVEDVTKTTINSAQRDSTTCRSLRDLGNSPDPSTLARWFETVICVQQAAANSTEFYDETARAVVNLVGLDRGMILLRESENWTVAAQYPEPQNRETGNEDCSSGFSNKVLNEIVETGITYRQVIGNAPATASLTNVEAVVAAPIFDRERKIVGAVYGSRFRNGSIRPINLDSAGSGITPLEAQIIQVLAAAVGAGLERVRHQADAMRMQLQFEQFFSSKLARELAHDPNLLEGRQRDVTILFSDVRDFSRFAEQLGPRETFRMMQQIMDLQTAVIHSFEGVVVDYVGDGLFAMWNAPTDQPDHAQLACRAALAITRQLKSLNPEWEGVLNRPLKLGIGINTGTALVGNTGSRVKFKYGPMGSAVNLASRIEDATKHLGANVLLSESTWRKLDNTFATRKICRASLSGIAEPVDLYELRLEENTPEWQVRQKAFETALEQFSTRKWADACLAIYPLIFDAQGDYDIASLQLLSRAVECLKSNPEPFDPTVQVGSR